MLFDANCQIGRRNQGPFYEPWKTDDLVQTMARCGIDRCWSGSPRRASTTPPLASNC